MPSNRPNQYQVNLGAHNSLETGNPWFVGEYARLTAHVVIGAASQVTIVGSNHDGLTSTLSTALRTGSNNTWSIVTTISSSGLYTIDTGWRWVNAIRATANSGQTASNNSLIFNGAF